MRADPMTERLNRQFHVRTLSGVLLETFDDAGVAEVYSTKANQRAADLNIETRYTVVPRET